MKAVLIIAADADEPTAEIIVEMISHYEIETGVKIETVMVERQRNYCPSLTLTELPQSVTFTVGPVRELHYERERVGKGQRKANKADRWR